MKIKTTIKVAPIAALVISTAILSGCSTNKASDYEQHQQKLKEASYAKEKQKFETVPEWFLNAPNNDASGIYAVGTSSSNNLQFSMNAARLNAEFSLAKTLNQEVSGRERSYMHAGSNGEVQSDTETVTTKFVDSSDIVGVETVKNAVSLVDGKYIVYTLLHLSYDKQAEILAKKAGTTTKADAQKAYKEVEEAVLKRKQAATKQKLEQSKIDAKVASDHAQALKQERDAERHQELEKLKIEAHQQEVESRNKVELEKAKVKNTQAQLGSSKTPIHKTSNSRNGSSTATDLISTIKGAI